VPNQMSSQNRIWDPIFIVKVPKRRKSCFTFIRPAQKWESLGFQKAYKRGFELKYLLRMSCCHVPSDVRNNDWINEEIHYKSICNISLKLLLTSSILAIH
jgi:hypothetical protein